MGEVDNLSDLCEHNEERDELEVERADNETPPSPPSPPPTQQPVIIPERIRPTERISRPRKANKQVVLTDEEPSSPGYSLFLLIPFLSLISSFPSPVLHRERRQ
jgi:hypothetical protein